MPAPQVRFTSAGFTARDQRVQRWSLVITLTASVLPITFTVLRQPQREAMAHFPLFRGRILMGEGGRKATSLGSLTPYPKAERV